MLPEELFERLINNEISREEFEALLEGVDDDAIQAKYDKYLEQKFIDELEDHFTKSEHDSTESSANGGNKSITVKHKSERSSRRKARSYPIAAIILAVISSIFGILLVMSRFNSQVEDQLSHDANGIRTITKQTPNRQMFRMKMQDGSLVHLNAVSSISYPQKFADDTREVEISGEAYFDIRRDEQRPFKIKVQDYTVQVLGTSFNIKAYDSDDYFSVAVESGQVRIESDEKVFNPVTLRKDQKLICSTTTNELKIININSEEELYWRKGILRFDSTPMAEVEKMLERWYGIDIIIEDEEIYAMAIGGTHQNKSIKSVIESIVFMTRTKYLIKDNSIIIKN